MTKTGTILAGIALAVLPAIASATCPGTGHEQAMSCAAGTVWDAETNSCVPTTG